MLDGDELELVSRHAGRQAAPRTTVDGGARSTIADVPDAFTLETVTRIVPQKNTKLEGLYATKHGFVTQCEAQGFRRITWFIDRPDVMARYTTTVRADQKKYPVLLSNGNLVASGENGWAALRASRTRSRSRRYLFALVAAESSKVLQGQATSTSTSSRASSTRRAGRWTA